MFLGLQERATSGDNLHFTIGSLQPTSTGPHKAKSGLDRVKDKSRKNGAKAVQSSSKHLDIAHRHKTAVEGESEVLGPPYPGNQGINLPNVTSLIFKKEEECVRDEEYIPETISSECGTDKLDEQGSMVLGMKGIDRSRSYEGGSVKLKEEVATNATISETTGQARPVGGHVGELTPKHEEQNPSKFTDSGLQESMHKAEQKQSSRPVSPMSTDADSEEEGAGSLPHKTCGETPSDKKLPLVDVTRLVRLPPEFGSLEVKLRITAGAPSKPQDFNPEPGVSPQALLEGTNVRDKLGASDAVQDLQKQISSIDHMLGVIDRYEHAHQTLGHVASRCDQMTMAEVLATESLTGRDYLGKGAVGTDIVSDDKITSTLTARESASLPSTVGTRVGAFDSSGRKPPNKKQKKVPTAPLAGFAGNLSMPGLQTVGSSQVPPISAPCLPSSSQVDFTAQAAALGTSQFGVSSLPSIPKATCGFQNPSVGCDRVNTALPYTKKSELETAWKPLGVQTRTESHNPVEKMVDDSLQIRASTFSDGLGVIGSEGLGRMSNKSNVGN